MSRLDKSDIHVFDMKCFILASLNNRCGPWPLSLRLERNICAPCGPGHVLSRYAVTCFDAVENDALSTTISLPRRYVGKD